MSSHSSRSRPLRLSGEAAWILSGQILASLAAIGGVRALTELMPPAGYGGMALGMTVVTFIQQTFYVPLSKGALRFYSAASEQEGTREYFPAVFRSLVRISAGIGIAGAGLLALSFQSDRSEWAWILATSVILGILTGWDAVLGAVHNASRRRAAVAAFASGGAWLRVSLAVCAVLAIGPRAEVALMGYACSAAIIVWFQYWNLRRWATWNAGPGQPAAHWSREFWRFAWPLGIVGALVWSQAASGRWALEALSTRAHVGLYSALFQIGYYPLAIAATVVTQVVEPILFQRAGGGANHQRIRESQAYGRRIMLVTLGVTLSAFLTALVLHQEIFALVVADEYRSVSFLLPWMVLGSGLFAAGQILMVNFMAELRTRETIAARGVTSAVGVSLAIFGAYAFGVPGVAYAGAVFAGLYLAWMYGLDRRFRSRRPGTAV